MRGFTNVQLGRFVPSCETLDFPSETLGQQSARIGVYRRLDIEFHMDQFCGSRPVVHLHGCYADQACGHELCMPLQERI
jgi:hypothetical protein